MAIAILQALGLITLMTGFVLALIWYNKKYPRKKPNTLMTPEEVWEACELAYHTGGYDKPEQTMFGTVNVDFTTFRWGFEAGVNEMERRLHNVRPVQNMQTTTEK